MATEGRVGVLLGRLSPAPPERPQVFPADWRHEIDVAAASAFDEVQWLYDACGANNPLETVTGRHAMRAAAAESGVPLASLCAHVFVVGPVASPQGRMLLQRMVGWLGDLGGGAIVVPLFGASDPEDLQVVADAVLPTAALARDEQVMLLLESDLQPLRFAALLRRCGHPAVAANFDMGNSVAAEQDPAFAVATLAPWIKGVHVKDRRRGGGSVPLGTGDVDLARVMHLLAAAGYRDTFVLETARRPGREVETAIDAAAAVRAAWRAAAPTHPTRQELISR